MILPWASAHGLGGYGHVVPSGLRQWLPAIHGLSPMASACRRFTASRIDAMLQNQFRRQFNRTGLTILKNSLRSSYLCGLPAFMRFLALRFQANYGRLSTHYSFWPVHVTTLGSKKQN